MLCIVVEKTVTAFSNPILFYLSFRVLRVLVDTALFHRRWANVRGDQ